MKILFKACTVRLGEWVATSEYFLIIVSQCSVRAKVYVVKTFYSIGRIFQFVITVTNNSHTEHILH
jgi:hypothetical protein